MKQKTDSYLEANRYDEEMGQALYLFCPVNICMRSMPSYVTECLSAQDTMPTELNYQGFVNMNVLEMRCFLCGDLFYLIKLLNPSIYTAAIEFTNNGLFST